MIVDRCHAASARAAHRSAAPVRGTGPAQRRRLTPAVARTADVFRAPQLRLGPARGDRLSASFGAWFRPFELQQRGRAPRNGPQGRKARCACSPGLRSGTNAACGRSG